MWGQDHFIRRCSADAGIIPTRVGTRRNHTLKNCQRQDHPHACGDKVALGSQTLLQEGSSPRVWGQGENRKIFVLRYRIIPTRVGTRHYRHNRVRAYRDHPHACGDKDVLYALNAKEIEPAATKRRGLGVETDSASTGSKISIADLLDDVKNYYYDVLSDSVRIIPTRVGTSQRESKQQLYL